ncbi:MAG: META domain-containing protein [Caldilineales bacterium]
MSALAGTMPLEGTSVTLAFGADGSVPGSDGCNNFSTTYTEDGSSLTITQPMASTMMACEDVVMAQAAAVTAVLTTTTDFSIAEDQLTLIAGDETLATFTAVSSDLTDTAWDVVNYNNGREAVVGILEGTEVTAYFGADGTVTGNAGCNQYFAEYTTDGSNISIGQPGSTMMFCAEPEGAMEQESAYLAALQSAATYSISGDMLQMRTAEDALAVVMVRREIVDLPEPAPATPTGVVTGAQSLNIRSGPGTNFPVIGVARNGDSGEIIGRSADGNWWVVSVPSAPGGMGWVSASFVTATDADDVPVIASPPPPPTPTPLPPTPTPQPIAPTATPLPLATPITEIAFWADRTSIQQGQCATLNWSVQNVQAVWVYPQGEAYNRFPRAGQGNEIVCPPVTTTYEMRVQMRDGTTQFRQVTINVTPAPPPTPSNPLSGTRWDVVNYNNGRGGVVTLIGGTRITMNFGADGQVTGTAGCNDYFAFYQVNGNRVTVGQPGSTSRFCADPEGTMAQEAEFLAALQSAATFTINGNTLEMRTAGDQIAIVASRAP